MADLPLTPPDRADRGPSSFSSRRDCFNYIRGDLPHHHRTPRAVSRNCSARGSDARAGILRNQGGCRSMDLLRDKSSSNRSGTWPPRPISLIQVIWEGPLGSPVQPSTGCSQRSASVDLQNPPRYLSIFAQASMVVFAALRSWFGCTRWGAGAPGACPLTLSGHGRSSAVVIRAGGAQTRVCQPVRQFNLCFMRHLYGITACFFGPFRRRPIFGGETEAQWITSELHIPSGSTIFEPFGGFVAIEHLDLHRAGGRPSCWSRACSSSSTRPAIRSRHPGARRRTTTALSVGISLSMIWVVVWFIAGIIALRHRHRLGRPGQGSPSRSRSSRSRRCRS